MTDQVINLTLRYRDGGSANAKRALETVERALAGTSREGKGAAQQAARVVEQFRNLGNLRPNDRVPRWFRAIGTEAAAAAGRIEQLTRGIGRAVTAWGQGAAGLAAGRAVLADPIRQTMDYDRQLRLVTNTAFSGLGMDARRAGMAEINSGVMAAIRARGGTREGTLATFDRLVASGEYKGGAAIGLLPTLNKFTTASGADPTALADIAVRARQTFGLQDVDYTLDQAMRAGEEGGFDLRDMAKWLPSQMAAASALGMKGHADFAALLAANQAAAITAGSRDEAGNNLVNLLAKINSQDTARDALKLGVNLSGSLAAARAKGTNPLDAFVNLTDEIAGRDSRYTSARDRARNAKDEDKRAAMESMADLLQGSAIGKIVQDRQALMALVGILGNRDKMMSIRGEAMNARGTGEAAFALVAESPSYKAELLAAEKANAMQTAMDTINPALGTMAEQTAALIQQFPNLSAAVIAATTALTAMAATIGVAAGAGVLMRGGSGAAAAAAAGAAAGTGARVAGTMATTAALAGGMPLTAWGASAGTMATAAGGVLAAGAVGYGAGTLINEGITGTVVGDAIGEGIARLMAFFGSEEARRAVDVNVRVENGNLVAEVNDTNARQARRQ